MAVSPHVAAGEIFPAHHRDPVAPAKQLLKAFLPAVEPSPVRNDCFQHQFRPFVLLRRHCLGKQQVGSPGKARNEMGI